MVKTRPPISSESPPLKRTGRKKGRREEDQVKGEAPSTSTAAAAAMLPSLYPQLEKAFLPTPHAVSLSTTNKPNPLVLSWKRFQTRGKKKGPNNTGKGRWLIPCLLPFSNQMASGRGPADRDRIELRHLQLPLPLPLRNGVAVTKNRASYARTDL